MRTEREKGQLCTNKFADISLQLHCIDYLMLFQSIPCSMFLIVFSTLDISISFLCGFCAAKVKKSRIADNWSDFIALGQIKGHGGGSFQLAHSKWLFCFQNIFCNILQCLSSSIILCLWEHHRYWSMKLLCLPSWGITSSFLVVEMSGSTQLFLLQIFRFVFNISNILYVYLLFRFVLFISNILFIVNAWTTSLRSFFANIFFPKIVTNCKS